MIEVTLVYANGIRWFAGGFATREAADAWIASEQAQPYWQPETQIEIVDKTPTEASNA